MFLLLKVLTISPNICLLSFFLLKVLKNKPDFNRKPWHNISEGAKDFVNKLLVKNPDVRLTASQALCIILISICPFFLKINWFDSWISLQRIHGLEKVEMPWIFHLIYLFYLTCVNL